MYCTPPHLFVTPPRFFPQFKGHIKGKFLINSEDPTACVNAIVIAGSARRRRVGWKWGQRTELAETVEGIVQLNEAMKAPAPG